MLGCSTLLHLDTEVRLTGGAIVSFVDVFLSHVSFVGGLTDAFKVDDRWPLLVDIIILIIGRWCSPAKAYVPAFLHGSFGHRTVVDIAVSIERRFDLPVGWLV